MENKIQVMYRGAWFYLRGIMHNDIQTTDESEDAMSSDYLALVQSKYPGMTFRSI